MTKKKIHNYIDNMNLFQSLQATSTVMMFNLNFVSINFAIDLIYLNDCPQYRYRYIVRFVYMVEISSQQ